MRGFLDKRVTSKGQAYAVLASFWVDYAEWVEQFVEGLFDEGIDEKRPMIGLEMIQYFLIVLERLE